MAAVAGLPPAGAWPFIIASAALHVVYIVLWAQTSGALAPIAALRETSMVLRSVDRRDLPG